MQPMLRWGCDVAIAIGYWSLLIAFVCCAASAVLGVLATVQRKDAPAKASALVALAVFACLTVSCGVLVVCFFVGDTSIAYVAEEMSAATGPLAWLFKVAGLWGGSAGSLLFWAWLISLFCALVAHKAYRMPDQLDLLALTIAELVLLAFLGLLLFSDNQPFLPIPVAYLDGEGNLSAIAQSVLGMNMLLEHWAMAVHPPTLFVGYAGYTIPFAYALASLILGDASDRWVRRSTPYALVSWFFLTIGIGLGAIWAYVVLGWGGYWGWDPVENASLLPWLVGLALIHSFTVVRRRGAFKRWAPLCACLAFCFVILGTFITRSGIVESVHAFQGDTVSLNLFLGLILVSLASGIVGVALRWKSLAAPGEDGDEIESFASKDAAYYVNNLVAIICAFVLAYFTISSALPSWMPLGGMSVTTGTYESIARPLGILYCALMAVCPLLSWGKTEGKLFRKRALVPGICAAVLFVGLMVLFFTQLYPSYVAIRTGGGTAARELAAYGPAWYYNGLAVVGFAVASLLFFNALFVLFRALRTRSGDIRARLSTIGGSISHAAMAVILIGLIGSSMYVTSKTFYLPYDQETDSIAQTAVLGDYELSFSGSSSVGNYETGMMVYTVNFDVTRNGNAAGRISPQYEISLITGQTKLDAGVQHYFTEDLFVVFNGFTSGPSAAAAPSLVLEVRTNPLVSFVWAGFVLMLVGMALSLFARREPKKRARGLAKGRSDANGDGNANVTALEAAPVAAAADATLTTPADVAPAEGESV